MSQLASQSLQRTLTLCQRARWLRRNPTVSEHRLWLELRGKRLGVQFRRQVILGNYIVDLLASSIWLVIEIDGGYHAERARLDAKREARLRRAGYQVLRLPAGLVLRQPRVAVECVRVAIEAARG